MALRANISQAELRTLLLLFLLILLLLLSFVGFAIPAFAFRGLLAQLGLGRPSRRTRWALCLAPPLAASSK